MPENMNKQVATIERTEKRPIPQIPWPLVQPFARREPNPTNNPASKSSGDISGLTILSRRPYTARPAPAAVPARNNALQD